MDEKYYFLGGGGFAIELYEYMSAEGKNVAGYYAQEENPALSRFIPWRGDMDKTPYDKFDREGKYILAIRLIRFRDKVIKFMEEMDLEAGSFISRLAYYSKFAKLGKTRENRLTNAQKFPIL